MGPITTHHVSILIIAVIVTARTSFPASVLHEAARNIEKYRAGDAVIELRSSRRKADPQRPDRVEQFLLPFTFDPTNGTLSRGDIWRMKQ